MLGQFGGECLGGALGEIRRQGRGERRIVGQGACQDLRVQVELGIGHQHGQFRPGQALAVILQFLDVGIVGQEFHRAVELARGFQRRG